MGVDRARTKIPSWRWAEHEGVVPACQREWCSVLVKKRKDSETRLMGLQVRIVIVG